MKAALGVTLVFLLLGIGIYAHRIEYPFPLTAAADAGVADAGPDAKVIEDSAAAEPVNRTMQIGDNFLDCKSFPLRLYDDSLIRCMFCVLQTSSNWATKAQPMLSCK